MTDTKVAYSVYYYDPLGTGYGTAGTIEDTGVDANVATTPGLKSGLNGDPLVLSFTDTSDNPMLAVTNRDTSATPDIDIYNYAATGTITPSYTVSWPNVDNPYSIVRIGDFLYVMDYDNAQVVELYATGMNIYTETGTKYEFNTVHSADLPAGYSGIGQALVVYNGDLYGLFSVTNAAWTDYESSWLIKFDIVQGTTIEDDVANNNIEENAFTLVENSGYFYICAIGGQQGSGTYNGNSKLQCVQNGFTAGTTPDTVLDASVYGYEFRDITFNGGTAYVLQGYYNASWNLAGALISGTISGDDFSDGFILDSFDDAPGYYWSVLYTSDNQRVWYAKGNQIDILDTSPAVSMTLGQLGFTNLNDMCYIGADPSAMAAKLRGYRSPLQASRTKVATNLRSITKGRPEATPEEFEEAQKA